MSQLSQTQVVRAGLERDSQHGSVMPPLYLSSNFTFAGFDQKRLYDYTRSGNPSRDLTAEALAELEQGHSAVVTSTGMSAVILVLHQLKVGDLLIAPHDCYGGTYRAMSALARRGQFRVRFTDMTNPKDLASAFAENPRMVWIETPSNPLLRITDISKVSAMAKQKGVLVVVDNTFLSPVLQKPLKLGADVVVHSTTKYLNGHSDVVGGCAVSADASLAEDLAWWANCLGITGAPFDSYLTLRGMRTLHLRMKQHLANAEAIVSLLKSDGRVKRVYHPSLPDHPGHSIANSQQQGFGAMISFELKGGHEAAKAFVEGMKFFSLAESLGGVESLVAHPATMTHAAMDLNARIEAGITDGLLRFSVGVEATSDLIADVEMALTRSEKLTLVGKEH